MLLKLLLMLVEFSELVWQDIGVWDKVEMLFAEPLLHPDNIEAKSIFPGDLMTLREMINLLVLVKTLVEVALAWARGPEYVPLMGFSGRESRSLKHRPNEFIVKSQHFVK
jgi:hypothetical protein